MAWSVFRPPKASAGKELDDLEAVVEGHFDVGRVADAGDDGQVLVEAVLDDLGVEAGRDDEGCAGFACAVDLVGREDGASADEQIVASGHCADGVGCGCGSEGDFGDGEAAVDECFGERCRRRRRLVGR